MSQTSIYLRDFNVRYGNKTALANISLEIPRGCIYALIGPSGCGKTTLLRSVNRLCDLIPSFKHTGLLEVEGQDVFALRSGRQVETLRRGIGMVFQQPNPLPASVMHNLLLPLREHNRGSRQDMHALAEQMLQKAALHNEVKDRLSKSALLLSGGQQQRLCIARALMLQPRILLFDEPCAALDPISTYQIEDLLLTLRQDHTIVIVTHNMEQARRISDYTAFLWEGELIEQGETLRLFQDPRHERTQRYITAAV